MKRITLVLGLFLLVSLAVVAQIRGNEIVVQVQPNHADWNYRLGEEAIFNVAVLKNGCPLPQAKVDIEAGPVMYADVKRSGVVLKDGTTTWKGTMKTAGFYRLKVWAHVGEKTYEGLCTVGYAPETLQPTDNCPADFDQFWADAYEKASYYPLEAHRRLLPERCTERVQVYEVSFNGLNPGNRIYGILCIPTAYEDKRPALLRVPGAGVRPYQGEVEEANIGAITLEIGVHGIPVTMPQQVYDDLLHGALNGYWETNLDNRDQMAYKRIFIGALRAVDYLTQLPEWNGRELGVTGASQGGMLSLVCGALHPAVTFVGVVHPAMCDLTASLHGKACGWPHYFYGQKQPDAKKVATSGYYDGVNFARRLTIPCWFSFGYNDEVVPPNSAYAAYNVTQGLRTLKLYPATGHFWFQEQWEEWREWLRKQLKKPHPQPLSKGKGE